MRSQYVFHDLGLSRQQSSTSEAEDSSHYMLLWWNALVIKILPIEDFSYLKLDIESADCLICFEYHWQLEFKSNKEIMKGILMMYPFISSVQIFKKNS